MPGDLMKTSKDAKKLPHHLPNIGYSSSSWKEKAVVGRYKECRKNHAASIGGYAVDGCLEFMPAGQESSAAAFKCAACGCHRNFHRRETDNDNCNCDCSSISTPTPTPTPRK